MKNPAPVTIVIPTYRREQVLIDTIECLLRLDPVAAEILVVDQTVDHVESTDALLRAWNEQGRIRWLRLPQPSIPTAMNTGLIEASQEIVLFLDDDIVPFGDLVGAHVAAHRTYAGMVAGRVLQPWDGDVAEASWAAMGFASTEARQIDRFMGGNFSLRKTEAIALGGFDENFVRVAYNFEREFADRWTHMGRTIHYCPQAAIRHLKVTAGGTRSFGEHLTTLLPSHSVGAYYYLLRSPQPGGRLRAFLARPVRAVITRHHLRRPWWIPVTLVAELAGMLWAFALFVRGPRFCRAGARDSA
jgi:GT2 family glycosyltransferase